MTNHAAEARRLLTAGYADDGDAAIAHALLALVDAIRDTGRNPRCLALNPHRNPNKDPESEQCIRGRDHDLTAHETKTGRRWW